MLQCTVVLPCYIQYIAFSLTVLMDTENEIQNYLPLNIDAHYLVS
jgi:hypothetical protein